jgi:integrase
MPVFHLTDVMVHGLICPNHHAHWEVRDQSIRGFFVDVLPSGRKSYRLRSTLQGVKRAITLGDAHLWTVDEARAWARTQLREIHQCAAVASLAPPGPLVSDFFIQRYLPYVKTYKLSWKIDECVIRLQILPTLGARHMGQLLTPDLTVLVQNMLTRGYAPGTINRVLVLMRYAYTLAIRWRLDGIAHNPAKELTNLRCDNKIERYLTQEQAQSLMCAVRTSENSMLQFIIPFLIYTGARKREALDAKWVDIDWAQSSWRIPKTKSGKIRHVPLSKGAVELLQHLKSLSTFTQLGADFIFPNPLSGLPFVSIYYSWNTARKQAGLPELRVHDLRHSFASFLVNAGRSLYEVQELLGHADIRTTSRYAHLKRERLMEAVEVIQLG